MKLFKNVIVFILLFIYIYSLIFRVLPVNTKIVLEAIGLLVSLPFIFSNNYILKKKYRWILLYAVIVIIWDFLVCLLNGTNTYLLTKAMVTPVGSLFGAQLICMCSRKVFHELEDFFFLVLLTVFFESILAVGVHFIPGASDIFTSILVPSGGAAELNDIAGYYRLVGIGNAVAFGALPSFTIGAFSAVYVIATSKNSLRTMLSLFMYAVIILVTFLIVRTSMAISALSIIVLLFLSKNKIKTVLLSFLSITVFTIIAISLINQYMDSNMFDWAFGFLISKDMDSGTQGRMLEWYQNTNFELKTLIIGDGLYDLPGGGYYKEVDVGFFRQIYYGGIIGLALMLYYHYKILRYCYISKTTSLLKIILSSLFLSLLVILAKGDTNLLSYFILMLVIFDDGLFYKKNSTGFSRDIANTSHRQTC